MGFLYILALRCIEWTVVHYARTTKHWQILACVQTPDGKIWPSGDLRHLTLLLRNRDGDRGWHTSRHDHGALPKEHYQPARFGAISREVEAPRAPNAVLRFAPLTTEPCRRTRTTRCVKIFNHGDGNKNVDPISNSISNQLGKGRLQISLNRRTSSVKIINVTNRLAPINPPSTSCWENNSAALRAVASCDQQRIADSGILPSAIPTNKACIGLNSDHATSTNRETGSAQSTTGNTLRANQSQHGLAIMATSACPGCALQGKLSQHTPD